MRKSEYARLCGRQRHYIKALSVLLKANKRLNAAYPLKESFGDLVDADHLRCRRAGTRQLRPHVLLVEPLHQTQLLGDSLIVETRQRRPTKWRTSWWPSRTKVMA